MAKTSGDCARRRRGARADGARAGLIRAGAAQARALTQDAEYRTPPVTRQRAKACHTNCFGRRTNTAHARGSSYTPVCPLLSPV